jgi:hypothetical protein
VIGIALALTALAAAVIYWTGRLLNWGRPEDYAPPAGLSEDDERWHTPTEGGSA